MDFGTLLSERSMEDILAERIRLVIGGEVYDLPVLPIAENRVWKERMDLELGFLLANIAAEEDSDAILGLFDGSEALFMDLLTSYDTSHVLPPVEVIEANLTPLGVVKAVLEVWRAARPLADIARQGMTLTLEPPTSASQPHMPSWLRRITGRHATSSANGPMSSSSYTSTKRPTGSAIASGPRSRSSGWAPCSRTTSTPTASGAAACHRSVGGPGSPAKPSRRP
jgi:hypothetical protein